VNTNELLGTLSKLFEKSRSASINRASSTGD
jgi:hypothetical protein